MKTKIEHLLFLSILTLSVSFAKSQVNSFIESSLILVSEDKNGRALKYSVETAHMVLDLSNGDFTLNANLSDLKTGDKKLDSLVRGFGEQVLLFRGNISENLLAFNEQQNDEKTYPLPGTLTLNGTSISCVGQFDPINLAEKSESRNYRMDFLLSVSASKITVKGLENNFAKQIVFEIAGGKLNVQQ